jgi:hypothetical protein
MRACTFVWLAPAALAAATSGCDFETTTGSPATPGWEAGLSDGSTPAEASADASDAPAKPDAGPDVADSSPPVEASADAKDSGPPGDATPDAADSVAPVDAPADSAIDAPMDAPVEAPADAPVGCSFPPTGAGGTVAVAAQPAAQLFEVQGTAQNQLITQIDPMPQSNGGSVQRGPCGKVGVVLRRAGQDAGSSASLVYVDVTTGASTPEVVEPSTSSFHDYGLLFDAACTPIVMRGKMPEGYVQYVRTGPGQWAKSTVTPALDQLLGATATGFSHAFAQFVAGGSLHVLALASTAGNKHLVHGSRPSAVGTAWTFESLPAPPGKGLERVRVDHTGAVHALYTNTEYPCDPCNLDLYYANLPKAGSWSSQTVQTSKWGAPNDEYADDPWLAVDAAGEPWVAATYLVRVITGSLVSAELRVYGRKAGTWCAETVASQVDGYQGSDGKGFTGARPALEIDDTGRRHVVFGDIAQWHDGNGWANDVIGQARYAVRAGTEWRLSTLFSQQGQTQSPKPLNAFDFPALAVAPSGAEVHVVGVQRIWDTNSIYNQSPVPVTLRPSLVRASVSLP